MDAVDHLLHTITRLGGVATRSQLRGFSGRFLTAAVRAEVIIRIRRSRYALPTLDRPTVQAIAMGGRLGGLSAAGSYGWWRGDDDRLHVSWPPHGNVAKPGRVSFAPNPGIVHHWRILPQPENLEQDLRREGPVETLAQVLLTADRETAIACADSAIRSGTLSISQVRLVFSRLPARVKAWERYVDGRSDSGLESLVRIWFIDNQIPFEVHPVIPGVGEADFLVGVSLITETDGREFHDSIKDATRDSRRDAVAASWGYLTMRIRYALVVHDPDLWQLALREHISRGDHLREID
jgi:very-short-patch-repair endonuclease